MRKSLFILSILVIQSCNDKSQIEIRDSYNIIIIAGQSNTHAGPGYDPILDTSHPSIKQLGRFYEDDYKIISAEEPLQHHVMIYGEIGFGLTYLLSAKSLHKASPLICFQETEVLSTFSRSWELLICMVQCTPYALNAPADKLLLSRLKKAWRPQRYI